MDILYYSNNCTHSQETLQFFVKNNLVNQLHFICVDRKRIDKVSGQIYILLENGKEIMLPPNIHSVPALLLIKENYRVIYGDEIMDRYRSRIEQEQEVATRGNGEPMGYTLGGPNTIGVVSESFTFFQATAEDLSAKGSGGLRPLNNYVSVRDDSSQYTIHTPPETYKSNKMDSVSIEKLEKKRNADMPFADPSKVPFAPMSRQR